MSSSQIAEIMVGDNPKYLIVLIVFALVFFHCAKKERNNPLDPESPIRPTVEITMGPGENAIWTSDTVRFVWRGNNEHCEFSYRINSDLSRWNAWEKISSVTFAELDDTTHEFEVRARFSTKPALVGTTVRKFKVDAVKGPAIKFFHRESKLNFSSRNG